MSNEPIEYALERHRRSLVGMNAEELMQARLVKLVELAAIDEALGDAKPHDAREVQAAALSRYIDDAKRALGEETVIGEPLAQAIERVISELCELRAERRGHK